MIAGDRVGPYVLRGPLEAGGCHPRYLADGPEGTVVIDLFPILDPSPAGQRFEREMGIVLKILRDAANPVIRPLHAIGTHDGCGWIATAPAGGEALQVWLEQPRAWPAVLAVVRDIGAALAAAEQMVLDVVLEDVAVDADGRACVDLAFGAAHQLAYLSDELLMGRGLRYMAPELIRGERTTHRTVQFAFCMLAWEVLYGRIPVTGTSVMELCVRVMEGKFDDPPAGSSVPAWVAAVLTRGLSVAPADRWPSMSALLAALVPRRKLLAWLRR